MLVKFVKYELENEGIFKLGKVYQVDEVDEWGNYWVLLDDGRYRLRHDEVEVIDESTYNRLLVAGKTRKDLYQFIWEALDNAYETAWQNEDEDYLVAEKLDIAKDYLIYLEESE